MRNPTHLIPKALGTAIDTSLHSDKTTVKSHNDDSFKNVQNYVKHSR